MQSYPRQLSAGTEAVVVALSDQEVGKLFPEGGRATAEAEKLEAANAINGLMVRLLRLDTYEPTGSAVLVLERLRPLEFRAVEVEKRRSFLEVFTDELEELHSAGFVHGHLQRESGFTAAVWDNILLTDTGLRLIDAGRSLLREGADAETFEAVRSRERADLEAFRDHFLSR